MKKTRISLLVFVVLFASFFVFADELLGDTERAAFDKLMLRIKTEKLSEKDCEELGFADETGGKMSVRSDHDGYKSERHFENEFEGCLYHLDVRNRAAVDLKDLTFECRFFYVVEKIWRVHGHRIEESVEYKQCTLSSDVDAGAKVQVKTKPFVMNSWSFPSGVYSSGGGAEAVEESAEGIWIKVSYTTSDGETVTRDFTEPKSLASRVEWVEK